jgi:eukaryotic-like serine/threonine-protein kinase
MLQESFAHYRILRPLGEGGMGVVYLALDTRLGRQVALKLVRPETLGAGDDRRQLAREAQAASALNHPHIVTIYDIGEAEGFAFIAMEYVEGRSLAAVSHGTPLPVRDAARYASQMADALAAAHAAGIIHRDLKPENVVITADGRAKVLDFGVAKVHPASARDAAFDGGVTVTGTAGVVVGTTRYMSPEQAEGRPIPPVFE